MNENKLKEKVSVQDLILRINGDMSKAQKVHFLTGEQIKQGNLYPLSKSLKDECEYIFFNNIELISDEKRVKFSNLNYKGELRFIFINSLVPSLTFIKITFGTCYFYNSTIEGALIYDNCQLGSLNIHNCQTSHFKLTSCVTKRLYFSNSTIGNLEFYKSRLGKLEMDKSFSNYHRICQTQTSSIEISNSETGYIYFYGHSKTGSIELLHSKIISLYAKQNYFSLKALNSTIPIIEFEDCNIIFLEWATGTKCELYANSCTINIFKIISSNVGKDSIISFIKSSISIIEIIDSLIQGQLNFRKVTANKKFFEWYEVDKFLEKKFGDEKDKSIFKCRQELLHAHKNSYENFLNEYSRSANYSENPKVTIAYSSIGKAEFTDFDLENSNIYFCHSKLSEIFISGVNFRKSKILIFNIKNEFDELEQKISFYSQIKKLYENQGDIFESTYYHSVVSDLKRDLIKKRLGFSSSDHFLKKLFKYLFTKSNKTIVSGDDKLDLIALKLNKLSNNHGESWRSSLIFLLVSSLILFIPFIWSLKYHLDLSLLFSKKGWTFFLDLRPFEQYYKYFFSFLNPVRPLDYITKNEKIYELSASNQFWDFLGRLVVSFSIYQFVVAFRRHSKKQ